MAEQNLDIVIRVRGGQVASQEIKGVGEATKSVGDETEKAGSKMGGMAKKMAGMAAGFAVYKGLDYIKGAVEETGKLASATASLQRITGLDTKSAGGWVDMAQQRGIQSKQLNQGFITLNKGIETAVNGTDKARVAWAGMGLDVAALRTQTASERMATLADAFQRMPNPVDKAAMAQKLFGRQAQAMMPLMAKGGDALNEQVAAFGKSAGMTDKTKASALQYAASQREMKSAMTGVQVAIGTALIPLMAQLAAVITPIAEGFAHLMQTSSAFRVIVVVLTGALLAFVAVMALVNLVSLPVTGTVLAIAAGIAALVAVVILLTMHFDTVKSVAVSVFNAIKNAAAAAWNWIKGAWSTLTSTLIAPFVTMVGTITGAFNKVKSVASGVISWLKGAIQSVSGVISGTFAGAWSAVSGAISGVVSVLQQAWDLVSKVVNAPKNILSKALSLAGKVLPGIATGGYIASGGMAIVGERGPELVNLPTGSSVIPNHAIGAVAGGGGGRVVVPVYLDSRQIALAMGDYAADRQAAQ